MTLSPLNEVTSNGTFIGFLCGGLVDRSTDSPGVRTVFSEGVPADVVPAGAATGPGAGPGPGPGTGPACLDVLRFDISDKKIEEASKKSKKNKKKQAAPGRFMVVELSGGMMSVCSFPLPFHKAFIPDTEWLKLCEKHRNNCHGYVVNSGSQRYQQGKTLWEPGSSANEKKIVWRRPHETT